MHRCDASSKQLRIDLHPNTYSLQFSSNSSNCSTFTILQLIPCAVHTGRARCCVRRVLLCGVQDGRIHTHTHTHTHAHTHTRTHTRARTYAHSHTRTLAHTHTRTCTHSHIRTHYTHKLWFRVERKGVPRNHVVGNRLLDRCHERRIWAHDTARVVVWCCLQRVSSAWSRWVLCSAIATANRAVALQTKRLRTIEEEIQQPAVRRVPEDRGLARLVDRGSGRNCSRKVFVPFHEYTHTEKGVGERVRQRAHTESMTHRHTHTHGGGCSDQEQKQEAEGVVGLFVATALH